MTVKVIKAEGTQACPPGHWALYDDLNFNVREEGWGRVLVSDEPIRDLASYDFDDCASSVVNNMDRPVAFYEEAEGGGRAATVPPGAARPRVVADGGTTLMRHNREVGDLHHAVSSAYVLDFPLETFRHSNSYVISAVHSGKCLEVSGACNRSGTNVQQGEPTGARHQIWTISHVQNGAHRLVSRNSDNALDVVGNSRADGANVQQWEPNGSTAQRWWITKAEDGSYTFVGVGSRKALDVLDAGTDNGANVVVQEHRGTPSQRWRLRQVHAY